LNSDSLINFYASVRKRIKIFDDDIDLDKQEAKSDDDLNAFATFEEKPAIAGEIKEFHSKKDTWKTLNQPKSADSKLKAKEGRESKTKDIVKKEKIDLDSDGDFDVRPKVAPPVSKTTVKIDEDDDYDFSAIKSKAKESNAKEPNRVNLHDDDGDFDFSKIKIKQEPADSSRKESRASRHEDRGRNSTRVETGRLVKDIDLMPGNSSKTHRRHESRSYDDRRHCERDEDRQRRHEPNESDRTDRKERKRSDEKRRYEEEICNRKRDERKRLRYRSKELSPESTPRRSRDDASNPNRMHIKYNKEEQRDLLQKLFSKSDDEADQQRSQEAAKQLRDQELKRKYQLWSKGVKQSEASQAERVDQEHESNKPLARYEDDADRDQLLKERELTEDPMLEYIRRKKQIKATKMALQRDEEVHVLPKYSGSVVPLQNRFAILPGYRWDGVDRSNGFEVKLMSKQNEAIANQEEAYRWSTADM
jgi:pre-mRNA-splicing factor CWC26